MAKAAMQYLKICGPLYTQSRMNPFEGNRAVRSTDVLTHYNQNEGPALNLLPELAKVQDPVLVITGEMDPVTPASDAELTVRALPQHLVQFERFANSGHGVYRDEPERYFEVLKAFVNAHSSGLPAATEIHG
jgi:proline iminopeptidase